MKLIITLYGFLLISSLALLPYAKGTCKEILPQKNLGKEVRLNLEEPLISTINASSAQIVIIRDNHVQPKIRQKLLDKDFIQQLKSKGFTHYIIEAPATSEMRSELLKDNIRISNLPDRIGPYPWVEKSSDYQDILALMLKEKMQVRAADHPNTSFRPEYSRRHPSYEQREESIANNILEVAKEAGRVIVLIGAFHGSLSNAENPLGITPAGFRLTKMGASVLSIDFKE